MWTEIDGRGLTLAQLENHVANLIFPLWRPSGMVLHNTGAPTLAQWHTHPGAERMRNLQSYYRDQRGWSAGPHAFVADDLVWLFTPFNRQGVHSPSWNGTKLGIEMVGDFDREDPRHGPGLAVVNNTVALFAMLHAKLGLDPDTIKLHKEDPRTTHDCPGKNIDKADFIQRVHEYMGQAGDHDYGTLPISPLSEMSAPVSRVGRVVNLPVGEHLNVRVLGSARGNIIGRLEKDETVIVNGAIVYNGATTWLPVRAGTLFGWVAARYIELV